jgi:hypothetical protein
MFDQRFHRQKWYFDYGLADGAAGLKQNIELAHALREDWTRNGWKESDSRSMLRVE